MSLKKITSLTMLLSMLVMTFTGILLFITPPGRVANWSNWEILGLTKDLIANFHTTFMVLFIVATILHIFYNIKPMLSYMKNSLREFVFFTKEMIVSLIVFVLFICGTAFGFFPFSTFLDFGDKVKNSWEKQAGTAPYAHAELSSLKSFTKKIGFDLEESKIILQKNNIIFEEENSLSQIAKQNDTSPSFIYELLKKNLKNSNQTIPLTGLGKKSIEEVASTLNISVDEFILKLKELGIEAKKDDKFKNIAEQYDMSVMNILTKLGYQKE